MLREIEATHQLDAIWGIIKKSAGNFSYLSDIVNYLIVQVRYLRTGCIFVRASWPYTRDMEMAILEIRFATAS